MNKKKEKIFHQQQGDLKTALQAMKETLQSLKTEICTLEEKRQQLEKTGKEIGIPMEDFKNYYTLEAEKLHKNINYLEGLLSAIEKNKAAGL